MCEKIIIIITSELEVSSFQRVLCVQTLMELGPEDVSLLERCLHFRGCCIYLLQWNWGYEVSPSTLQC